MYNLFTVFDYKGGELSYALNLSLEGVIEVILQYDDLFDWIRDNNSDLDLPDDELINYITDEQIKEYSNDILFPGNLYAFDTHSDYACFKVNENGLLVRVNPIDEPEFCTVFRKVLNNEEI